MRKVLLVFILFFPMVAYADPCGWIKRPRWLKELCIHLYHGAIAIGLFEQHMIQVLEVINQHNERLNAKETAIKAASAIRELKKEEIEAKTNLAYLSLLISYASSVEEHRRISEEVAKLYLKNYIKLYHQLRKKESDVLCSIFPKACY